MPGHDDRKDLVGEHPMGDTGQLILFILFLGVWIADSFFLKYSTFLSDFIPWYVKGPLVFLLLGISVYFAKEGHDIVFGEDREQPEILNNGVFSIVRHPLYFAVILFYTGLFLFTCSLLTFIVWIVIVLFYNFIAAYEEGLLQQKFGGEYEQYRKQVPRWIPKIRNE